MKISVIICTANRSQRLLKTLKSIATSSLPESVEWEVLIVDNNSSDATRQLSEEFCRYNSTHFRYVFEPKSGKSHALNRGIVEATGDVLAFTDDDVTVETTWIRNLTANLEGGKWAGAAGRTFPEQPFELPNWLSPKRPHALAPLALFDPPLDAGPLKISPYGNNMAFHKSVFERHGGFRIDLGPGLGSGVPQKSEDSEFGNRLLAAGEQLRYEPSAIVYHAIPTTRVQKSYFLDWWFDKARADIRVLGSSAPVGWSLAGVPIGLFRRLGRWTVAWLLLIQPSRRFEHKVKVWTIWGEIVEHHRASRA
jgi:glucosyl-dolichyl phosphate glucuronosyltransferase